MDPPPPSDSTELAERPTARPATNAHEGGGEENQPQIDTDRSTVFGRMPSGHQDERAPRPILAPRF